MKKLIFIILLSTKAWADCPLWTYPENHKLDSEINNICQNELNPVFNIASGSSMTVTYLKVSSITATSINFGQTNLNTYKEGTWTPTDQSGANLTFTVTSAKYTRIGNAVYVEVFLAYPAQANGLSAIIGGFPYTINTYGTAKIYTNAAGVNVIGRFEGGSTNMIIVSPSGGAAATNANLSGAQIIFTAFYFAS